MKRSTLKCHSNGFSILDKPLTYFLPRIYFLPFFFAFLPYFPVRPSFLPLLLSVLASFSSLFYPPLLLCYLFSSFLLFTSIPVLLSLCFLPSVSYSPLLISYSPLLLFSLFPILRLFFFFEKREMSSFPPPLLPSLFSFLPSLPPFTPSYKFPHSFLPFISYF